jgi:CRP-like cAMP-binding protein
MNAAYTTSIDRDDLRSIQHTPILRLLREEALAGLVAVAQRQDCTYGELIWGIGEAHSPAYILVVGSLRLYYLAPEGQELTLAILHPGDICGLYPDDAIAPSSVAQVLDAGTVLYRLPRPFLLQLIETSPALSCAVLEQAWRQLVHARAHMVELTCCDIRTRVAHMLARLASPENDGVVRVTRERLGLLIGASREGVTRALDSLRAEGLVAYEPGQREIVVRDRERLSSL